jgi:hypothetical protein
VIQIYNHIDRIDYVAALVAETGSFTKAMEQYETQLNKRHNDALLGLTKVNGGYQYIEPVYESLKVRFDLSTTEGLEQMVFELERRVQQQKKVNCDGTL